MKKYNYYAFEYLSEGLLKNPRMGEARTYDTYESGDTVVIEKEGRGIFLGRIVGKALTQDVEGYNIVMDVDVAAYFEAIEREKKRQELMGLMEEKFREIDKIKKYEYYATLDKEFGELYEEFKNL